MTGIRLDRVELVEIDLALREPFAISSGETSVRRVLLLRLEAEGLVAWSECVAMETPNYSPETVGTCRLALREWLAPRLVGCRFEGPEAVHRELERDIRGHEMAKAALEMGFWGLFAGAAGCSLSEQLGGSREVVETGISLGIQPDVSTLVEKARSAYAQGYRKIKIKIKPGRDVEEVRAVRTELGPDAPLMADANSAYRLDDVRSLLALDELDLLMIEQPLAWNDLVRHAELQRRLQTALCLDESITGMDRAEDMIRLRAGRIINIKPARVGGLTVSRRIHDLCAEHGLAVWCGGMLETGIGRAYNVALASLQNFTLPGDLSPSQRYWRRDIVDPEWTMDDRGRVRVPTEPGLGVAVDEERIDALAVRRERIG